MNIVYTAPASFSIWYALSWIVRCGRHCPLSCVYTVWYSLNFAETTLLSPHRFQRSIREGYAWFRNIEASHNTASQVNFCVEMNDPDEDPDQKNYMKAIISSLQEPIHISELSLYDSILQSRLFKEALILCFMLLSEEWCSLIAISSVMMFEYNVF